MDRRILFGVLSLILLASCAIFIMNSRHHFGDLAYIQSGDVYIKELPKGQPLRLTRDGLNSSPRISPSGKWVAFRKGDGELWIIRSDGQSANLVHSGTVEYFKWALGTDLLAFIAGGELRIWEAGRNESRLIVPSPPQEYTGVHSEFLWSADGKWITYEYTERRNVLEDHQWKWKQSVRKINVEKGESEEIIAYPPPDEKGGPGNTALAAWVGSRIYLWQCEVISASIMTDGCPLFYIDLDDLHKKQNEVGVASLLYPDFLAFSPDGKILAVSEGADRFTWTNKRIMIINLETREEKVVTERELAAFSPVWSPDSLSLAYVAAPDTNSISESNVQAEMAKRRIWIMKTDGRERRQLTSDDGYREESPLWLADGKHILFARLDAQGQPSLWLIQENGKSLRKITDTLSAFLTEYEGLDYYGHFYREKLFDLSTATSRSTIAKLWIAIAAILFLAAALMVSGIFTKKRIAELEK